MTETTPPHGDTARIIKELLTALNAIYGYATMTRTLTDDVKLNMVAMLACGTLNDAKKDVAELDMVNPFLAYPFWSRR